MNPSQYTPRGRRALSILASAFLALNACLPALGAPAPRGGAVRFADAAPALGLTAHNAKVVALARASMAPVLPASPGAPQPWQPAFPVYKGVANLATGNLMLSHQVTDSEASYAPLNFTLYFNSQSGAATLLGAKWSHTYDESVSGTSPAVVTFGNGTKIAFALSSGAYVSPAGVYETLSRNADGTWELRFKDGTLHSFLANGRLNRVSDQNGNAVSLAYNAAGQLAQVSAPHGRSYVLGYSANKLVSLQDDESRSWTFSYDASGRLKEVLDPVLDSITYKTAFAYGGNNNVASVTNRLGKTWTYTYDASGNFSYVTDPLQQSAGQSIASQPTPDANNFSSGASTSSSEAAASPDASATTYPVDTVAVAHVLDTSGRATDYGVDASGRVTATRDSAGTQTNLTYDGNNNLTSLVEPNGSTVSYSYDARGNRTGVTDPSNRTVAMTYDAANNLTSIVSPGSGTATFTYDSRGNKLSATDESGRSTSYTYNSDGTVASMADGAAKTWYFGYDAQGNRTLETNPLGQTTSYTFVGSRMVTRTDARNRTTSYGYDAWGRQVSIDYPTSADQSLGYDAEGRMVSSADGTGTRTYTYDALGRKTGQTDPRGNTTATYDAAGRIASQTDVSGRTVTYAYDGRGALSSVGDSSNFVNYTYAPNGQVATAAYSNGLTTTYGYDSNGRGTSVVSRRSNNTLVSGTTVAYNSAGLVSQVTETHTGAVTTYSYDASGRLLSETRTGPNPYTSTYTYNARGLRATAIRTEGGTTSHNATYTYDDAGRLTAVSDSAQSGLSGSYVWNADGTLASYPGPGYRRELDYDEEGRVVRIKRNTGTSTTTVLEYGYGFDGGRRWRKDLAAGLWTWYPCGVACCAGELVEQTSNLSGLVWQTSVTRVPAPTALLEAGAVFAQAGRSSTVKATSSTADQAVVDAMGVLRGGVAAAQTAPCIIEDEQLSGFAASLQLPLAMCQIQLPDIPTPRVSTAPCGPTAMAACKKTCKNKGGPVTCQKVYLTLEYPDHSDRYDRVICICKKDSIDVGREICKSLCDEGCSKLPTPILRAGCKALCNKGCEKIK